MSIVVVYITHPNKEHASHIADRLLKEKYIACANIYPIHSHYNWEGELQSENEWVSLCKTSIDNIERIEQLVGSIHSYDVPCISHWEAKSNESYEKWVLENVKKQ